MHMVHTVSVDGISVQAEWCVISSTHAVRSNEQERSSDHLTRNWKELTLQLCKELKNGKTQRYEGPHSKCCVCGYNHILSFICTLNVFINDRNDPMANFLLCLFKS